MGARRAGGVAGSAAGRGGDEVGLAAVGRVAVAVGEAHLAGDAAAAQHAGASAHVRAHGADGSAGAAVGDVRLRVDLAAVARGAVAVRVAPGAHADGAAPHAAEGGGVGQPAAVVADAAAHRVGHQVDAGAAAAGLRARAGAGGAAPRDAHAPGAEPAAGTVAVGHALHALVAGRIAAERGGPSVGAHPAALVGAAALDAGERGRVAVPRRSAAVLRGDALHATPREGIADAAGGRRGAVGVAGAAGRPRVRGRVWSVHRGGRVDGRRGVDGCRDIGTIEGHRGDVEGVDGCAEVFADVERFARVGDDHARVVARLAAEDEREGAEEGEDRDMRAGSHRARRPPSGKVGRP